MGTSLEAMVLGVRIRQRSRREALATIRGLLAADEPSSVYFIHAATANLAFEDSAYREALNRGDVVLNDGTGVRWAARAGGVEFEENLVGTDLVPELLAGPRRTPLRVYLLGGRPEVSCAAAGYVTRQFEGTRVVGFAGGYFSPSEEREVVQQVRRAAPDLLLVGMGNPRQELFIDRNLADLGCRVAVGVGGLLDHFAGELRRAPFWMRRLGLEWLQLLIQQPHKWRRYVLGIPRFLWRIFGSHSRRWLVNGLVMGGALALAVMMAEAGLRLWRPQILERYPVGLYVASPQRQYAMRPGFQGVFRYPEFEVPVAISKQGLRESREYSAPAAGVQRILALGDSFTMGYSVEEPRTWVRGLEALLRQRIASPRWEVINAGVPGYATRQELIYLEEEGLALAPNLVVLGFFVGNDIVDNASAQLPVEVRDGRLVAAGPDDGVLPFDLRLALARRSHLYHAVRPRGREANEKLRRQLAVYVGRAEAGWQGTAGLLDRIRRLCAARNIRLIVVLIPERAQVDPQARQTLAAGLRRTGLAIDPALPNRRLLEICRLAGVEAVDLLEVFTAEPSPAGLYFTQDGHWTRRGNAVAAHALADYLAPIDINK